MTWWAMGSDPIVQIKFALHWITLTRSEVQLRAIAGRSREDKSLVQFISVYRFACGQYELIHTEKSLAANKTGSGGGISSEAALWHPTLCVGPIVLPHQQDNFQWMLIVQTSSRVSMWGPEECLFFPLVSGEESTRWLPPHVKKQHLFSRCFHFT